MAQPEEVAFMRLLYVGVLAMLVLVIGVVIFVVVHQRNAYALQAQLRQQELDYQVRMLQAMVASQESERARIAHDLHDEIGAALSAARLFVNQVQVEADTPPLRELSGQASRLLGDTLQGVRHITQNLSPLTLAQFGFCRAVAVQAGHLVAAGLQVEVAVDEAAEALPAPAQLALYRIVQELLANAGKHARARHLTLSLCAQAGGLLLTVTDDGCGFAPELVAGQAPVGIGLAGLRARTQLLGGELSIESAPGAGTRVALLVPH